MRLIIYIYLTLISAVNFCDAQTFEWAFSAGAHSDDYNTAVKLDSDGNVYSAGVITGGMMGEQKVYDWAIHLTKFSPDGQILWTKLIPRNHDMYVRDLYIDESDHIYLLGSGPRELVYDNKRLNNNDSADSFILKVDSDGTLLDYGLYEFRIHKFKVIDGMVYFTAWTLDAKIYKELSHGAKKEIKGSFFAKMALGESPILLFECENVVDFQLFDTDYNGNFVFVASVSNEAVSFGNQHFHLPNTTSVVFKYDTDGQVAILADYYSKYEKGATDIVIDHQHNIYVAHRTGSDLQIEDRTITDVSGCTILKFDETGKLLFNKPYTGIDVSCYLAVDQDNSLMVGSKRENMPYIDFYPAEPLRNPSGHLLITKFSSEGHVQWIKGNGGRINDLICDNTGRIYVVGYYNDSQLNYDGHWVYNNSGNSDADLFLVCVSDPVAIHCPPAEPLLVADRLNYCEGDSVTIKLERSFGYDFNWMRGDELLNKNDSVIYTSEEGTYSLIINGNEKCPYQSKEITIKQHSLPDVLIHSSDSTILCNNDTLVLSTFKETDYNFKWLLDNQNLEEATDSFTVARIEGKYVVEVTNEFCFAKDSIELKHFMRPSISIPDDTIKFSNQGVNLFVHTEGNGNGNWYYNHDLEEFSRALSFFTNSVGNYLFIEENTCGIDVDNVYLHNEHVGINDEWVNALSVRISPNPCTDFINCEIEGFSGKELRIQLFDLNGRLILQQEHPNLSLVSIRIDTNEMLSGEYIVIISNEKHKVAKKIVVL